MKTAVYSGTFDPLHIGHRAVLDNLAHDPSWDSILLIVSPQSPFKDAGRARNATERLQAAEEAVDRRRKADASWEKVHVDDIEMGMSAPQYTIRTLDALAAREPGSSFTLIVGADQLRDIRGWRDYSRILLEFGILVFPRDDFDISAMRDELLRENPGYRIELRDAAQVHVSSSGIRRAEAEGKDVSSLKL